MLVVFNQVLLETDAKGIGWVRDSSRKKPVKDKDQNKAEAPSDTNRSVTLTKRERRNRGG